MDRPLSATSDKNAVEDVELIRQMAVRFGDDVIAAVLNRGSRRTGKGNRWTRERVVSAASNTASLASRRRARS